MSPHSGIRQEHIRPRMNITSGVIYDDVVIPAEYGYYGDINGVSANAMYNRYLAWFIGKYGNSKSPLHFKEWIKWAKSKGLVLNANAETSAEAKDATKAVMGTGRKIAIAVLVVMAVAIAISMAKPLTNQSSAPAA